MGQRLDLHEILVVMLGSRNVYFQPPANVAMKYPAIVYERDSAVTVYAANVPYRNTKRYQVTVIDSDPDSLIADRVATIPLSRFSRHFATEGLNHDIYSIFF